MGIERKIFWYPKIFLTGMKNILIAQIHALGTQARGVMLETLQTVINENPEANVYYLTCSNTYNVCYINTEKKPEICYLCKQGVKKGLNLIDGKYIHLEIEDLLKEEDLIAGKEFISKQDKINKQVWYKDYEVGEAAVSSYISKTRDKNLINIKDSFAETLVEYDVSFYNALDRFFEEISFSTVYNFNGRHSLQRAVLNICRKHGVECINKEIARPGGYLDSFPNVLPHHIYTKVGLIDDAWNNSSESLEEKIKTGSSFFENKVKGVFTNDKIYTQGQVNNKLPEEINYDRKTFVIFTSSDDEFAAVGRDFVNPFFKDQNEGITYVAKLFANLFPQYNLIIRMHPNLKGVNYDYVDELRGMGDIADNVSVIAPESSVDSYALLKIAEKIIVFGSTIGLEASYWGKPVILLGKSFYFYRDVAYVPSAKEEIQNLLESELEPKQKMNAIRFGYYFLKGGEKTKYFHHTNGEKVSYNGVKLYNMSKKDRAKAKLVKFANDYFNLRLLVK